MERHLTERASFTFATEQLVKYVFSLADQTKIKSVEKPIKKSTEPIYRCAAEQQISLNLFDNSLTAFDPPFR